MPPRGGPSLTLEQRQEIGSIASANRQLGLKGINISHVAKRFHATTKAVKKWLMEGLKQNPNYADKPRPGRPPKLQQLHKNNMQRPAVHRNTSREIKERLERVHGIIVSLNTVSRVLGSGRNPLNWLRMRRGKVLNPTNIQMRLEFCMQHLGDDFKKWVFLDQFDNNHSFEKDGSATHSSQAANSSPTPAPGKPWSFRMYAAVGHNFKSPLIFTAPSPPEGTNMHKSKETFTAQGYIQMMEQLKPYLDARYPDSDYVIIQDHAPQHTAKAANEAMVEMGLPILADYTAQS